MKTVTENFDPRCAAMHTGLWLADLTWLQSQVDLYHAGLLRPGLGATDKGLVQALYAVDDDGIAHLSLNGSIMKGQSKFGGTSSVLTRQALRTARADPDVFGAMMAVDSPGGTVAGIDELASEIRAFDQVKPLHVHAEGMMASAALWAGVQGRRVTASRMTDVGSIGVVGVVEDTSAANEKAGRRVYVMTNTGATLKAAGTEGTQITAEHLAYFQGRVDDIAEQFKAEIMNRRQMGAVAYRSVASGRTWAAPEAKTLGLIDAVETRDQAMSALRAEVMRGRTDAAKRARRMGG
ncbi:MAG: S49 family peptidase [Sulfuricaulis sp.]|nr:S49 family peptidase [Sulfuricaulis sp.]